MTDAPLRFTEYLRLTVEVMAIGATLCGVLAGFGMGIWFFVLGAPAEMGMAGARMASAAMTALFFVVTGVQIAAKCLPLALPLGWLAWSALSGLDLTARLWTTTAVWCLSCLVVLLVPGLFAQADGGLWTKLNTWYAVFVPGGMIGGLFAPHRYRKIIERREAVA